MDGAGERDRTADLPFTRRPLCLLSYTGGERLHGSRIPTDLRIPSLACGFVNPRDLAGSLPHFSSVRLSPAIDGWQRPAVPNTCRS
jgi:hypothetical protein